MPPKYKDAPAIVMNAKVADFKPTNFNATSTSFVPSGGGANFTPNTTSMPIPPNFGGVNAGGPGFQT